MDCVGVWVTEPSPISLPWFKVSVDCGLMLLQRLKGKVREEKHSVYFITLSECVLSPLWLAVSATGGKNIMKNYEDAGGLSSWLNGVPSATPRRPGRQKGEKTALGGGGGSLLLSPSGSGRRHLGDSAPDSATLLWPFLGGSIN